jgi:hypothetical protein
MPSKTRSMPLEQPSALSPAEVDSVVAFLFNCNGIIKQNGTLDATTLAKIEMPSRNGFFPARPEWKPRHWQPDFTPEPIPG